MSCKFHQDGSLPTKGEVWVFGSNEAGVHGLGAALIARERFGAVWGVGYGYMQSASGTGHCFAIPTKNRKIEPLSVQRISGYVEIFLRDYERMPDLEFFITSIGCGLTGYEPVQIAPMFSSQLSRCSFPHTWKPYLKP